MPNIQELKRYRNIHMIGIGGTSMSGIAEILNQWGFNVTGSDANSSAVTDKLIEDGIKVTIGHSHYDVDEADLVVYSAAIKPDDPELKRAKDLGIETAIRADFLGEITKAYRNTICVAGTHGKSTTTSMVALCFLESAKDPSIQIGADLEQIGGNYKVGKSEFFILESCEYVESFLKFFPKAEIILNIDDDHLDYFKNIDNIKTAFSNFVRLLPDDGILVYNADDPNSEHLSQYTKAKSITFGINKQNANFVAKNINFNSEGCASFDVYHNNVFYKSFRLSVPGRHNVLNALSCIALCNEYGIDRNDIKNAILKFKGAGRRFEFVGEYNDAKIYDDYGHHPSEIAAVANAMKNKEYNHSWVVFQPHTYSRTKEHLKEFAQVLTDFDNIIVTDIYAAREKDTLGISSLDIVKEIEALDRKALYISSFDDIIDFLKRELHPGDILITQGAGTITSLGRKLVNPDYGNHGDNSSTETSTMNDNYNIPKFEESVVQEPTVQSIQIDEPQTEEPKTDAEIIEAENETQKAEHLESVAQRLRNIKNKKDDE